MTPPFHPEGRTARRDAFSSDAWEMPSQDVTAILRSRSSGKGSKGYLLVILHYLLKNNITFMCEILQGKSGGVLTSSTCRLAHEPLPTIGGSLR